MRKRTVRRQGEAIVRTESAKRIEGEDTDEQEVERRQVVDNLPPDPAYVTVQAGQTKKIGNYEFLKMSVSVSVPCAPEESEIRKTYKHASRLVEELLDAEYERRTGE